MIAIMAAAAAMVTMSLLIQRVRPLAQRSPTAQTAVRSSPVTVVIPARNEQRNLPLLLGDLAAQLTPASQIVVIDDDSTDDTAELARRAGATVHNAPPRPAGWNPKVWALCAGVARADSPSIVFLDADVRLAPAALGSIVEDQQRTGGLLSVAPHHRAVGVRESLSAVCNVVAVAGGGPGFGGRSRGAVGSCIAVTAADYHAVGGHAASPATIVDDLDLAAAYARTGRPVTLRRGGELVAMRSYPDGLRSVFSGWSKNLAAGMTRTSPLVGAVVAGWIAALVAPLALAAQQRWTAALLLWSTAALHTALATRSVGRFNPVLISVGAPLLGVFTTIVTGRSLLLAVSGRSVDWKGRRLLPTGLEAGGQPAGRPGTPGRGPS